MNPGYAGRSQLPQSLMNQLRPIVFVVPDWRIIAKGLLSCYGFMEGDKVGFKLTTVFRTCSSLLSKQDHYDFGLRQLNSILDFAKKIKAEEPKKNEE